MCLWADKWIKDGCTSCLWLLTTSSAIQPPVNLHPSHTAALNYTQKVIRLTSFTELSTRWVTCRAGSPFAPASPCVTRFFFFLFIPFICRLSSRWQTSWVMTGRLALMRPTGSHSRDLGCLELPSGPPCPSPLVTQKRNAEGPPLTLVRAVTHSAAASLLTSSWLKYPPRPVALHPPPFTAIITSLFHMLIYFISAVIPSLPFLFQTQTQKLYSS